MSHSSRSVALALLAFGCTLTGTLLIPAVRPFFAAFHSGSEGGMHAFFSVNMLGAALGAPWIARLADGGQRRRAVVVTTALADGLLLLACTLPVPLPALLALRVAQGAANVGALSIIMGEAARSPEHSRRSLGLAGAGIVTAIALGAPLGTLLLAVGPAAPLGAAALVALGVAAGSAAVVGRESAPTHARVERSSLLAREPRLWLPMLWVGVERFSVGCFVVTFSLWAHGRLGLGDATIGLLYTAFLVPFAVGTGALGRWRRLSVDTMLCTGAAGFALSFLALLLVPASYLALPLAGAGLSSALLYVPALELAATLAPTNARATAMALPNAAGTLGMLLGTALAGTVSAAAGALGFERVWAWTAIFIVAALAPLTLRVALAGLRLNAPATGAPSALQAH